MQLQLVDTDAYCTLQKNIVHEKKFGFCFSQAGNFCFTLKPRHFSHFNNSQFIALHCVEMINSNSLNNFVFLVCHYFISFLFWGAYKEIVILLFCAFLWKFFYFFTLFIFCLFCCALCNKIIRLQLFCSMVFGIIHLFSFKSRDIFYNCQLMFLSYGKL